MADVVNVSCVDVDKKHGSSSFYFPADTASSIVDDFETLLQLMMVAGVERVDQVQNRFVDPAAVGTDGDTPLVSQAAALAFVCADDSIYTAYILAPVDGTFLGDGTVDDMFGPVADVIGYLLANATNADGIGLSSYDSGVRVELTPGFIDVLGAASEVVTGSMVAEFWPQDGADIKVG